MASAGTRTNGGATNGAAGGAGDEQIIEVEFVFDTREEGGTIDGLGERADAAHSQAFGGGCQLDKVEGGFFVRVGLAEGLDDGFDFIEGEDGFELYFGGALEAAGLADSRIGSRLA